MSEFKFTTAIMPLFPEAVEAECPFDEKRFNAEALPIVASRDTVLFPSMTISLNLGREKSIKAARLAEENHQYLGVVLQHDPECDNPTGDDLVGIGCLGEVIKTLEMPDGNINMIVRGVRRFKLEKVVVNEPMLLGMVSLVEETRPAKGSQEMRALVSSIKKEVKEYLKLNEGSPMLPTEFNFALSNIKDHFFLVNFFSSNFPMDPHHHQSLLNESDLYEQALLLARKLNRALGYARIQNQINEKTQSTISDWQRKHYLREQINTLQNELGDSDKKEADALYVKLLDKPYVPANVRELFKKERARLARMNEQAPEYSMQFTYLQTFVDMPWGTLSQDNLDLHRAQRVLDHDHYGLEKVKERILEHLAVLKMRGDMKSPILCLYGPPGVGKTSLGQSIATALNRKYVRISLGGLHDESEIRGHRKTYIGSMPGRVVSGLIKAGTDNPVFVLDEIDKISADVHGDPASALLEVLDPEQNTTFHDNYLDIDYDLSKVLFIATANDLGSIAPALRDRMEIIDLSGYILEEKIEIGVRHLLPKQKKEHGLEKVKFSISRKTMEQIISQYTQESGVRGLDKNIAKVMRKAAWKVANGEELPATLKAENLEEFLGTPKVDAERYEGNDYAGVVTGLAWTSVGGCILMVESALCKGKGEKLSLTGNLGDVMKESAMIALQWIKSNADYLEIPEDVFNNYSVHIHCPEGAIPKDGPSAGITMVTSLASVFTQRKVRAKLAMTGEITLRGRVTPIGGVKEKILAAKRAGITDLLLCIDNKKHVDEIKPEYLKGLAFHYVRDIREALDYALLPEKVKNPKKLY